MSLTMPFVLGVALPLIVSSAALLFGYRRSRAGAAHRHGRWGAPLALGGGFFAGYIGIRGFPRFPPAEATEHLAYFALAAFVLGLIESARRTPWWLRWPLRAAVCVPLVLVMTRASRQHDWTAVQAAAWVVGLTLAILVAWASAASQAARFPGATSPLILLIAAAGSSVALLLTGSLLLAQLALALTVTLFVSALAAWRRPSRLESRVESSSLPPTLIPSGGGVSVALILLAGLLMNGYFYSELPAFATLTLFTAPVLGWAADLPRIAIAAGRRATGREHVDRDAPGSGTVCIRVAVVLAAVIATVVLCWLQNAAAGEYEGY